MISADTNLFLYAANPDSPFHKAAKGFFSDLDDRRFVVCELVLIEIYMQLRNPAVLRQPRTPPEAATFCEHLRHHPRWQHVDYDPDVSPLLWQWARDTSAGFRAVIDARLALTLRFHGVTEFATANVADFHGFGFEHVWNPAAEP